MDASNDTATHAAMLRIAHDHPSLAGHFPGQPVVPGVLLLDRILDAAQAWLGATVTVRSLPQVKFISPLLPGQDAQLELKRSGDELRFIVRRGEAVIAQGAFGIFLQGQ
jgi:3-hydroxymyristoyl/3-hydroxydecanoyl-(acyl carrier protein) dehydratase